MTGMQPGIPDVAWVVAASGIGLLAGICLAVHALFSRRSR